MKGFPRRLLEAVMPVVLVCLIFAVPAMALYAAWDCGPTFWCIMCAGGVSVVVDSIIIWILNEYYL